MNKILLVAPFEKPESTAWLICRALRNFNLDVERFSYREELWATGDAIEMNKKLKKIIDSYFWDDFVIVIKGDTIWKETIEHTKPKTALWHFDFDAFYPSQRLIDFGSAFDFVFLMCYPWVDILRDLGINALFMPQATDPIIYHPTQPVDELQCDVAFIGSWKPGREEILNELANDFSVKVFGNLWQKLSNPKRKFEWYPPVYLKDFNNVCNSAKVILNITPSNEWPIYEKTFSQRIYMTMAAGGYIATDYIPGLELKFLAVYDSIPQLKDIIEWTKNNEDLRKKIRHGARMEILRNHTYYHRIKEVLICLGLSPYARKNTPV